MSDGSQSLPPQRFGTLALHAGQEPDPTTKSRGVPIYATTSYVFDDAGHAARLFGLEEFGNIYTRLSNPTTDVLEKRLAALDGGVGALAFASGQSAITAALLTICHAGQNFVSATSLYGGTWTLFTQTFRQMGIEVRFFDPDHPEEIDSLVDENTRCVYMESLGNPKNDVPDFRAISDRAHAAGVPLVVDNTVMTPALFRPVEHGCDIVVYSLTKFIGGHGTHIGGAIVDLGTFRWADDRARWPEFCAPSPSYHGAVFVDALAALGNVAYILHIRTHWLRDTGAALSPFGAFLFLQGLETLHLRMPRHCENAQAIAEYLEAHPLVEWVNYPGLPSHPHHAAAKKYLPKGQGAIIGFGIKGGKAAGQRFVESTRLLSHLANIGDAKSLVIHPASTTHSQLTAEEQARAGVSPEYVRLSIGIEDLADIRADIEQALAASQA
ncbi:MAG: O-acetylhomoserine aminocarboxypropyltransferase/cysteine synthase [Spirochaetaceae bacterium]|nr:O-acetylhomoserine aminocarboxypropyltransferase/cysteine synthase [Myxococcales bacterium]MCB9723031.1 O-acetylhomoserine aminocarboxypropyltransferase/cysteine synthase [Spirochaetaceae bacterium]HPG27939.1 O-acetylhomoserine aminocarboxypropyltransferase/cysteine synthase [Myxococcota bacterium]